MTGTVFDIQRFSLHDGPGIRTTVFLKGCPLNCIWCHNPESNLLRPQLMFRRELCQSCGSCVAGCPNGVHRMEKGQHTVDLRQCTGCGACAQRCPYGALKQVGIAMDLEQVMQEVRADAAFYRNSGGGLTVSGGEPMMQLNFLLALLKAAKAEKIHTCIETSGYAPAEAFRQVREYVDLFLFDCKQTNDEKHRAYTGVSNRQILENLNMLYESGADILLRCPMIPGCNDTEEHIRGICALDQKYPGLKGIELLPYHDMGKGKWAQIGKTYALPQLRNMDDQGKQQLLGMFRALGCEKAALR